MYIKKNTTISSLRETNDMRFVQKKKVQYLISCMLYNKMLSPLDLNEIVWVSPILINDIGFESRPKEYSSI